jgi:hypothetical protein
MGKKTYRRHFMAKSSGSKKGGKGFIPQRGHKSGLGRGNLPPRSGKQQGGQ